MNYQIGDLTIDVGQRQVLRDGEKLDIGGLTFDLLHAIVESSPNIISHDELVEKVWLGRPTSPETITQRAMMLRQALGDDADNPKYVEVVRGQGFKLIPAISPETSQQNQSNKRVGTILLAVLLAIASASYFFVADRTMTNDDVIPNSVAVLPIENISADPNDAYFSIGLHSEIINQLARIRAVRVIARTSVLPYGSNDKSIADIASELKVGTVLESSLQISGDDFRLALQLIDAKLSTPIWSENYDGQIADIFDVQANIASEVANALRIELSPSETQSLRPRGSRSSPAVSRFFRARSIRYSWDQKIEILDQAIAMDPEFARAYAERAYTRSLSLQRAELQNMSDEDRVEIESLVALDAESALQLNPQLGYAHIALANLNFSRGDIELASKAYLHAVELSPNDTEVLDRYAGFLSRSGRYAEAAEIVRRALELDPTNGELHDALGDVMYFSGRYEETEQSYRDAIALGYDSAGTQIRLGLLEIVKGNGAAALAHLRQGEFMLNNTAPWPGLSYGYAMLGLQDEADRAVSGIQDAIDQGRNYDPLDLVIFHLAKRDSELSFVEAEKSLIGAHERWRPLNTTQYKYIVTHNLLNDPILEQPEWVELREKMGYPDLQ